MTINYHHAAVVTALGLLVATTPGFGTQPPGNDVSTSGNTFNTGGGNFALEKNTEGVGNTGYGAFALQDNTTGFQNTAVGNSALHQRQRRPQYRRRRLRAPGQHRRRQYRRWLRRALR